MLDQFRNYEDSGESRCRQTAGRSANSGRSRSLISSSGSALTETASTPLRFAARPLRYGPNTLEERRRLSLSLKFLSRFRNPLVLILLAAAAISALTGDLASFIILSTIVLVLGSWGRTSSPVMACCSPPGTLVPADGRLLEARDFFVNEALLTGESFPTEKHARDEGVDSPEAPMRPTPPLWAVQ